MFPVAATRLPVNLRRLGWVALACSAAGLTLSLSACGGGTRSNFFEPSRIVSFGDENSAFSDFTSAGLKLADGTTGAAVRGFTYTVQSATIGATVVCSNPPRPLQPGEVAADCGTTSNGATLGPSPTTDYYTFSTVSSTKLEADGTNQRTVTTAYNCASASNWVQVLAGAYGRGYNTQCPLEGRTGAISYAAFDAKTADVINQIAARRGELGNGVLVTVMVGQNDILEQFDAIRAGGTSEGAAIAELEARADRMAAAVKDVIGTGAKVVLSLTPSLNNSPKAAASVADADLLSKLVVAYNDRLYVRGLGSVSGRDLVGVNPDIYTNPSTRNRSYEYAISLCNTAALTRPDGSPTSASPDPQDVRFCNTTNVDTSNNRLGTFMWADSVRFAPLGHSLIGSLAFNRARRQL